VASHVVLPATFGYTLLDGATKPSFVELVADRPQQRPHYFVSHFMGEPVIDLIRSIAQHTRDRAYGGGRFKLGGGESGGLDGDDGCFWIFSYAARHWSAGDVTADPSQTAFHCAMRVTRGTVAIVDKAGQYFSRVWCSYEACVSLSVSEDQRDAVAREHGAYTFDLYTAVENKPDTLLGAREAVGLIDGLAPADTGFVGEAADKWKALREAAFPYKLLDLGMRTSIQAGSTSLATDKKRILNTIIAVRNLNAEPPPRHEQYEVTNKLLHGRVAADSLRLAFDKGGAFLNRALQALSSAQAKCVTVGLRGLRQQPASAVVARAMVALPESTETLLLSHCETLLLLPRLSMLTRLRTLSLNNCRGLTALPEMTLLREMQVIRLVRCDQLVELPSLAALKKLKTLELPLCATLTALPDLQIPGSDLDYRTGVTTHYGLKVLNLQFCVLLAELSSEMIRLDRQVELQLLDLRGCTGLEEAAKMTKTDDDEDEESWLEQLPCRDGNIIPKMIWPNGDEVDAGVGLQAALNRNED